MAFLVEITPIAETQIDRAYFWYRQHNAEFADRWFRSLMNAIATARRQYHKARMYLKQALKADPKNPILWTEVERDFRYIERHTGLS